VTIGKRATAAALGRFAALAAGLATLR